MIDFSKLLKDKKYGTDEDAQVKGAKIFKKRFGTKLRLEQEALGLIKEMDLAQDENSARKVIALLKDHTILYREGLEFTSNFYLREFKTTLGKVYKLDSRIYTSDVRKQLEEEEKVYIKTNKIFRKRFGTEIKTEQEALDQIIVAGFASDESSARKVIGSLKDNLMVLAAGEWYSFLFGWPWGKCFKLKELKNPSGNKAYKLKIISPR